MNILGRVSVLPHLPKRIGRLGELARNLYWTWTPEARALFRHLDRELWDEVNHNPVIFLRDIAQAKLDRAAQEADYLARYDEVMQAFDRYMSARDTYFTTRLHGKREHVYAYFCAEYGWHEGIALYSGGLGILAGDHTKAASDLGIPLVGVGLWYPEGYFRQRVAEDGQQEAYYERHSPSELPFTLARDAAGNEARVAVTLQGREVQLRAWRVQVGRVPVYLLDCDVPENSPEDRAILSSLYGGDQRTRVAQEYILGIGGVRMLRALDIHPTTWHMNEGHSAFMALERCRELVEEGLTFEHAREVVACNTVFTVHTPVPAGNDAFPFDLISSYFSGYWGSLGLSQQRFLELGRFDLGWGPIFSMPALALRFSTGRNGVSKLHGETSRRIWNGLWPEVPTDEVPIGHVTNGVHVNTWVSREVRELALTTLQADFDEHFDDEARWRNLLKLDNAKLWEVRRTLKAQSVRFLRRRVLRQQQRYGATPTALHDTAELFDPDTLTIGFARRFATYKRATLIFRDLERLSRILSNDRMPMQLVFAGKAHPADRPGQELIAQIHTLSRDPRFTGKVIFLEDYDMAIGRALTRGVDVWLNNPRRPLEASGTSGQKAAMNGILNLSILDGWWPEGFDGFNGWAIGSGDGVSIEATDPSRIDALDAADADALYDLLEREVAPLYYERDEAGIPQAWLERAKAAIATITPTFNARRMVVDYVKHYYAPASERLAAFSRDGYAKAIELAAWRDRIEANWGSVYFSAKPIKDEVLEIGDEIEVEAVLHPRNLKPEEIKVEVVYSPEADALKHNLHKVEMECVKVYSDGGCLYKARVKPEVSGRLVYGVRAYPVHEALVSPFDAQAIRWA
jgi:starch phosphorylase